MYDISKLLSSHKHCSAVLSQPSIDHQKSRFDQLTSTITDAGAAVLGYLRNLLLDSIKLLHICIFSVDFWAILWNVCYADSSGYVNFSVSRPSNRPVFKPKNWFVSIMSWNASNSGSWEITIYIPLICKCIIRDTNHPNFIRMCANVNRMLKFW
jgi:hypothetical protein